MNERRLLLLAVFAYLFTAVSTAQTLEVDSVLVTLIEEAEVPALEAGPLIEVNVREGDLVKAGDMLGRLDDTEAAILAERARIDLEMARTEADNDVSVRYARKSYEVAVSELQRAQESVEKFKKSISESELDRLRLAAQKAELEIEQAQLDLRVAGFEAQLKENAHAMAEHVLRRRHVLAPLDGMVVSVPLRQGEWVEPGATVARLLRVDRLKAEGFVSAREVTGDLRGSQVILLVDLPGRGETEFPGVVTFVSPEIDPVNGQIRICADIENRELLLRPGVAATLRIQAGEQAAAR